MMLTTWDATPTLDWDAATDATTYTVQVDDDPAFASPLIDESGLAATDFTPAADLAAGVWHWRVQAHNDCHDGAWSATRSFTVADSLPAPALLLPADAAQECAPADVTFSWQAVTGADEYEFLATAVGETDITATVAGTSYTPAAFSAAGVWSWRVRAVNAYVDGAWSAARTLTITEVIATAPTLLLPANEAASCDATPTLTWEAVAGAESYEIEIADEGDFRRAAGERDCHRTELHAADGPGGGQWHWRVRASMPVAMAPGRRHAPLR